MNKLVGGWVQRQSWWQGVIPFQKGMMSNFGYAEEDQVLDAVLETYAFTIVGCIHHCFFGLLTFPMLYYGWASAGPTFQLCFYIGCLGEMGFDLYDTFRTTILRWCPATCPCMTRVPNAFWIISILHHTASIGCVLPLLKFYPDAWQFHWLASSLLFAAGFAQGTGAYKFSLNTNEPRDFKIYKSVVILQFLIIWGTRVFLWFYVAISLALFIQSEGDTTFFYVSIGVIVCFSCVNLAMVYDCTTAAIKWLPRSVPKTQEDRADLDRSKSATSFSLLVPKPREALDRETQMI